MSLLEAEFEPFQAEIRQYSREVKREIGLAKARTDHQEQKEAAEHRKYELSFFTQFSEDVKYKKDRWLQRDEQRYSKSLSIHMEPTV